MYHSQQPLHLWRKCGRTESRLAPALLDTFVVSRCYPFCISHADTLHICCTRLVHRLHGTPSIPSDHHLPTGTLLSINDLIV